MSSQKGLITTAAKGKTRVKSTCCSLREPGSHLHRLHASSQVYITHVPGDLVPSYGLHTHVVHTHRCTQTFIHIKINNQKREEEEDEEVEEPEVTGLLTTGNDTATTSVAMGIKHKSKSSLRAQLPMFK